MNQSFFRFGILLVTSSLMVVSIFDTETIARYLRYNSKGNGEHYKSSHQNVENWIVDLNLRNVVLDQPVLGSDIPFFWHAHSSDEVIVKKVLRNCFGRKVIELNDIDDIESAKETDLVSQDRKNFVITSPFIRATAEIFTKEHHGRMFGFFRHPIDYEMSDTLPQNPDNWLTRFLSDTPEAKLTYKDLGIAKHVIRETCVVGIITNMQESLERIGAYFGWELTSSEYIDDALVDMPAPIFVDHASAEWQALHERNSYDQLLFELADSLWRGQSQTIIPFQLQLSRAKKHKKS